MTTGCTLGSPRKALAVADSTVMSGPQTPQKSDALRRALARVLRRQHGQGLSAGRKQDLGLALGSGSGNAASARAQRVLNGELFPDEYWTEIAAWAGMTPAELWQAVGDELDAADVFDKKSTKEA